LPKKKLKSVKKVKDNVIKLPKKIKENITLDKNNDGSYITNIESYKAKDLERQFTIDDCLLLLPKFLKRRTWTSWRTINVDLERKDKIGPEYVILGQRIYVIKLIWLLRYIKGHKWEREVQAPVSATQSEEMKLRSLGSL